MQSSKDKINLIIAKAIPLMGWDSYINMIGGMDAITQSVNSMSDQQADKLISEIAAIIKTGTN